MTKQASFTGILLTKLVAFILVSVALAFSYMELKSYNIKVVIKFCQYEIDTYTGILVLLLLIFLWILFSISNLFSAIVNGFEYYREKYRGNKVNNAITDLIESSILLAFGGKREALNKIQSINKKYLSQQQNDYAELVENISSSDTIPITLYGYINKFPFIKNQLSKKLACVEFKLGNIEKALDYARQYNFYNNYDEEINILLAKIYARQEDWKSFEGVCYALSTHSLSLDTRKKISNLYLTAAKDMLNKSKNNEVLIYCKKALEFQSDNIDAAEIYAEVAISQKNYELVRTTLLEVFSSNPNFQIFLILKKFSDLPAEELYQILVESCPYNLYLDLFLSIAVLLELPDRQRDIIDQIA